MATRSDFLNLILPGAGEYVDTWHEPTNENFQKIDEFSEAVNQELEEASGSKATLSEYLRVGHDNNGALLPTPEVARARNSYTYGDKNADDENASLSEHLEYTDKDIYYGREGSASLRDALAFRHFLLPNTTIEGSKDTDGYPTWLGRVDKKAILDGVSEPIYFLIGGKVCRVRTSEEIDLEGSADGTWYYLYAEFQEDGVIRVDGDSSTPPPATPNGTTGPLDVNSEARLFTDTNHPDWTAEDVQPGDILDIPTGQEKGRYFVKEVGPGGENSHLEIIGLFPVGGISSIDYVIRDGLAVTFGFTDTKTEVAGRHYIGEAYYDSDAVAEVRAYHFGDRYVSEWRDVDVSGSPDDDFEEVFDHNLGADDLDIKIQAKQTGSGEIEQLSLAAIRSPDDSGFDITINNTQSVDITNTLTHAACAALSANPVLNGTVTGALSGDVTADPSGDIQPSRSVFVKWDRKKLWVKNAISQLFYRDYGGAERNVGEIRVVVSKRG